MHSKDTENNIIFVDDNCSDLACNGRTHFTTPIKYAPIKTTNAKTVFVNEPYLNKLTLVLLISRFCDLTSLSTHLLTGRNRARLIYIK